MRGKQASKQSTTRVVGRPVDACSLIRIYNRTGDENWEIRNQKLTPSPPPPMHACMRAHINAKGFFAREVFLLVAVFGIVHNRSS